MLKNGRFNTLLAYGQSWKTDVRCYVFGTSFYRPIIKEFGAKKAPTFGSSNWHNFTKKLSILTNEPHFRIVRSRAIEWYESHASITNLKKSTDTPTYIVTLVQNGCIYIF